MIEIQDVASKYLRCTGLANFEDEMAFKKTGNWQKSKLTDEVNNDLLALNTTLRKLSTRALNANVRDACEKLRSASVSVQIATSEEVARTTMLHMSDVSTGLDELIGSQIRSIFTNKKF